MTPLATSTMVPHQAITNSASLRSNDTDLLSEIEAFRADCLARYVFNNRWDSLLATLGIAMSIAVVGAGFSRRPEVSAVLGAVVGALVTAQRAFPFGQRASFYRLLIGQSENLATRVRSNLLTTHQTVDALSALRMDFAQELPRGTGTAQNIAQSTVAAKDTPTYPASERPNKTNLDSSGIQAETRLPPEGTLGSPPTQNAEGSRSTLRGTLPTISVRTSRS
jgi:hypothetical protein